MAANNLRHGHCVGHESQTYQAWSSMLSRCMNPRNKDYGLYGGRGISVCQRWRAFENFLVDMGSKPLGLSLDRFPDRNGNYEPGNCRWATAKEQNRNRRCAHEVTIDGVTKTIAEWAETSGVGETTIGYRLRAGWDPGRAVTAPLHHKGAGRFTGAAFRRVR